MLKKTFFFFAIALVADPPVILLDEPSAGVDISSQEFLWKFINQMRQSGRTIILTSHSMEECEALCSRTAIMVDGQFGAIGSIQHLKERFGKGYTLTIKVGKPEDLETAKDFIHSQIPYFSFLLERFFNDSNRKNDNDFILLVSL
uniref:ATPase AAA-type core domain-containing protein n=1 Tax=Panagrolaimus davidi TaxID=227884 RepID=A0A914QAY4_9BILA